MAGYGFCGCPVYPTYVAPATGGISMALVLVLFILLVLLYCACPMR